MISTNIAQAAALLKAGELVAFPTETVYGLGADASNPAAVKKIFAVKGRPADHPVIVHIGALAHLTHWAKNIPDTAYIFARYFWPGPLTLILPAADHVSALITGNQPTIGLRMPSHWLARELLTAFGGGIAAPSANCFGRISPTSAAHVKEELGEQPALILDGGDCPLGLESTIIDLTSGSPRLLRPGPYNRQQIQKMTGIAISEEKSNAPRVSGSLASHYAPRTVLKLVDKKGLADALTAGNRVAVMALHPLSVTTDDIILKQMPADPEKYAQQLYAVLRELDKINADMIVVEMPPEDIAWQAVCDRLRRAAAK